VLTVRAPNGHLAALSRLYLIISVGRTVTRWHVPTQARLVYTQRRGTSARIPSQTIWEGPKLTGIDFKVRHIRVIMKHLIIGVPLPYLHTIRQPLLTQVAQGTLYYQMLRVCINL
jgi:hypothetical protein